ncbi:hypothetical protein ACN38_g12078 [Penicillium nordicum]|uniref:Uncharacterized protein n=1 Tax=Penicillium nordicum TaxID=229535 RepID=A0A0M8NXP8_9EURO|nr:hypothetical protein ACN38_g12078 [Penicillium nordicum]
MAKTLGKMRGENAEKVDASSWFNESTTPETDARTGISPETIRNQIPGEIELSSYWIYNVKCTRDDCIR